MDHESSDSSSRQNRSLGRTNSTSSSGGKLSFTFSGRFHPQLNRDVESENVSVAGDNGDRAFRSSQVHDNSSIRSVDNATDRGVFLDQPRSASLGKISNTGVRLRRFFSLPSEFRRQLDADVESEAVSQSGDIGDRALLSRRGSESSSVHFSINHTTENGVFPIPEDALLHSYGFWSRDPLISTTISPVSPLPEEIISPLSTDAILHKKEEVNEGLPPSLEYISCLIHLAVFGVLGVLTRYLLQKLFGPGVVGLTSDKNILYLDLPSNMLGSFLMGWFGVVFKGNISRLSDQLAIGITTGYLGSLTTFSGWNQKMLDLSVHGHWVFAVLGYLLELMQPPSRDWRVKASGRMKPWIESRPRRRIGLKPLRAREWRIAWQKGIAWRPDLGGAVISVTVMRTVKGWKSTRITILTVDLYHTDHYLDR